jgi:Zn finger protein HypA/HybF involved in hydrogenase expression
MLDSKQAMLATAKRDAGKYYFVICNICFWCASVIQQDLSKYRKAYLCPICKEHNVDVIPLSIYDA